MKPLLISLFCLALCSPGFAADKDNGDELHMESCTNCHDSTVYTRGDKKVKTLPKLGAQVRFCRDNLGITWFDDQVEDVILYLNKDYYHF